MIRRTSLRIWRPNSKAGKARKAVRPVRPDRPNRLTALPGGWRLVGKLRSCPALNERFLELRGGDGEAEVEALHLAAAVLFEKVELRLRLDALGDNAQVQTLRQLDDRADDRRVLESIRQVFDKVAVDL